MRHGGDGDRASIYLQPKEEASILLVRGLVLLPGFACARPTQQESGSGVPLPFLEDRETFSHRQQK